MLKLSLNDPVKAELQTFDFLMLYSLMNLQEKNKLKRYLHKVMHEAQATNNTYVASLYRTAYAKLRGASQ